MDKSIYFTLILSYLILPILVGYIFISYIKSLENSNCKCSDDIRRKYIKYYGYVFIILALLGVFTLLMVISYPQITLLETVFKIAALLINFLAAYVLYTYSEILESNDCKCSQSWKRAFIKYYGYFLIFIIGMIFFSLLFTFILHIFNEEDKYIVEMRNILRSCRV